MFNFQAPPNTLDLHSTKNTIDRPSSADLRIQRSPSDYEIQSNISQSQSESALKNVLNSPIGSATKDMVLSPLTKLAKGVQNIGVNLDRKLTGQVSILLHQNSRYFTDQCPHCSYSYKSTFASYITSGELTFSVHITWSPCCCNPPNSSISSSVSPLLSLLCV